jgi:hypothetical protein
VEQFIGGDAHKQFSQTSIVLPLLPKIAEK